MSASRMKKRASSSQDLHPKLEITDAFDLFLNADLCECVFPSVDNCMEKERRDQHNQKSHYTPNADTAVLNEIVHRHMYGILCTFPHKRHVSILSCWKHTHTHTCQPHYFSFFRVAKNVVKRCSQERNSSVCVLSCSLE